MKKNKIFALSLAVLGSVSLLASCGNNEPVEYALITDVGDVDEESFNQTSWEALRDFAEAHEKTYGYYRPTADSTPARLNSIDQAVQRGAKIIVCPGYLFEDAVYEAQTKYPEVKFVLIDGTPHTTDYSDYKTAENTVSIIFKEEIAGFLAGYAAVMDGNRDLGFCGGMAVPAVQRFGSGYVQGIDYAAKQLDVQTTVRYYYAGDFQATAAATALMDTWYTNGMDTVFASGGKVYLSVVEGVKANPDGTWIGVDVDQSGVDPKVLTSATKGLRESVTSALEVYFNDQWSDIGGENYNLGLDSEFGKVEKKDYVGIPTADKAWRFKTFTVAQYNEVLADIKAGEITITNSTTEAPTVDAAHTTVTWDSQFAAPAEEE